VGPGERDRRTQLVVVAALRRTDQLDDTLLMFLSDNGGCAGFLREACRHASAAPLTRDGRPVLVGNRVGLLPGTADMYMSYDLPRANASNTPLRLYKHCLHEGGISTPLIVHWPVAIPEGVRGGISHSVGHLIDVTPTVLDAAGTTYPGPDQDRESLPLEGESLLPLIRGELSWGRARPVFWEHEGNRAVRSAGDGRWKLERRFLGAWELYDTDADRTELHPELPTELGPR
jgi:arylsulfatase